MKSLFVLFCLVTAFTLSMAENPGLVGGVKMPIVEKIKAQYFEEIMQGFETIDLDDMKVGDLKITGITAEVKNTDPSNIKMTFNEEKNGLDVVVDNTDIRVHCNWKYKKSIVKVSGSGDIKGPINHVAMTIGFETQDKDGHLIPKVNVGDFELSIPKKKWDFKFHCKHCPSKVNDLILKALKGPLVDKVKKEAKKVVNNQVAGIVNSKLVALFPTTVPLNDEMSIGTATTGPINVKADYLSVPIDATIFLTSEGYSRPFEAPEIPSEDPENPGEILLFASKYVYQTLEKTINKTPMRFDTSILGIDVQIDIDGTKEAFEIDTQDKNLHLHGGAKITIPLLNTVIDVGASTDIDVFFTPGDSNNMIYVDPDFDKDTLKLTLLKANIFGWSVDLSGLAGFANWAIGFLMDQLMLPTTGIAKLNAIPLTATAAQIDFHDTYTEAGVAFNFGLD